MKRTLMIAVVLVAAGLISAAEAPLTPAQLQLELNEGVKALEVALDALEEANTPGGGDRSG